jgi:hypothetical protein
MRAPVALSGTLAFVMALAVGWTWPAVLSFSETWALGRAALWDDLRAGDQPLSFLAKGKASVVGYDCDPDKLLVLWLQLREAGLMAFHDKRQHEPIPGLGRMQIVEAWKGRLGRGLDLVADPKAAGGQTRGEPVGQAVVRVPMNRQEAAATYDIKVPADGTYELCLRLFEPGPGNSLRVAVDGDVARKRFLPQWPTYYTYNHEPILLDLSAGKHQLTITLDGAGTRLDLLELIPRKRGLSAQVPGAVLHCFGRQ